MHSFAGDDWRIIRDELRGRGLIGADASLHEPGDSTSLTSLSSAARREVARKLWREGSPVPSTLSEKHCQRRGVTAVSDALRHHSAVPLRTYDGEGPFHEALLAAITAATGELCGVEVTFLASDGARARVKLPRKTIGQRPAGSAVRLSPLGPALLVGEGVFTCLSAAMHFGLPAWALLSTSNLRSWRPPEGVGAVLIAADRGRDGTRSAAILASRLRADGLDCSVRAPPSGFGDWNDALCGPRLGV
ncbi:toprim domain-containing protein [Phenylobacterium sp. RIFCSPHIGHO2_01_FULL_69_31]|uniref:DUF7146 domain-containing protein n=1 Tax=Phenylobacterium sp. RIFCSPHIGHO2_01_FULL_69_31 TaxID=1801944 RepID=UPI0025FAE3EE|nr:toprim domain-containing protein [Phenylobacterium sp. RIFCSPHIGHO2_01_FULL_69_31]